MTFRNLTPGSIVHVLVKGEPIEYKEGTVVSVGTPRMEVPSFNPNQFPMQSKPATQVVDVTYTVDGKNITDAVDVTANVFQTDKLGSIALVSTDKQDIVRELHATLNVSEGYLKDVEKHEKRVAECKELIGELDTAYNEKQQLEKRFQRLEEESAETHKLLKELIEKIK